MALYVPRTALISQQGEPKGKQLLKTEFASLGIIEKPILLPADEKVLRSHAHFPL